MSRLWADCFQVVFAPGRVTVARVSAFSRRVIAYTELPVESGSNWQASLLALRRHLAGAGGKGAGLRVVLTGNLVRYLLVPGTALNWDDARNQLILKHYFSSTYGETVAGWQLAAERGHPEAAVLVAAVDPGVIVGVAELSSSLGLRLASVQPGLGVVANQWRERLRKGVNWMVTVDPECAWVCLIHDGQWMHLKRYADFQLTADSLLDVIQREKIFADMETAADEVLLYAPGLNGALPAGPWALKVTSPDWGVTPRPQNAGHDLQLALAA